MPQENDIVEIWNREALRAIKSKPIQIYSYYIGNLYRMITEMGLKYINEDKVILLKSDLWNEGIDTARDILGLYQDRNNFELYGIDISPTVCFYAKKRLNNTNIIQGDIRFLPFRDNSVNIVLDLSTIDHLPENQALKVLHEYFRVLRRGGVLVLVFWSKSFSVKYLKRLRDSPTQFYFSVRRIKNEVKVKFDILEEYAIATLLGIPYLLGVLNKLPRTFGVRISRLVLRLELSKTSRYMLKNFAGLYAIIGRKPVKKSVEEVISYWDQRIKEAKNLWEGVLWKGLPVWNRYIDELQMHHLKSIFYMIKPSDTILDLGCGVGRFTFRLAKLCRKVYGVDTSRHAIDICKNIATKSNISNVEFEVMDARKLSFNDETFDYVFSITTLQHITNENDLVSAIREILRVLKKNGIAVLLECTTDRRRDEFVISLPREKWFEIIERAGGRIEKWWGIDVPFLRKIAFRLLNLNIKNKVVKKIVEHGIISLLKIFEYTIPKILKNMSWYTVIIVSKRNGECNEKRSS